MSRKILRTCLFGHLSPLPIPIVRGVVFLIPPKNLSIRSVSISLLFLFPDLVYSLIRVQNYSCSQSDEWNLNPANYQRRNPITSIDFFSQKNLKYTHEERLLDQISRPIFD